MPKQEEQILPNVKSACIQHILLESYKTITLNPEVFPTFTQNFISYLKVHTIRLIYTTNSLMPFIMKINTKYKCMACVKNTGTER
jgi:hypothetical protein